MGKLLDTFKQTADTIAFLDRGSGVNRPDVQSAIEKVYSEAIKRGPTLEIISVKDFGAKGDGISDDSLPFENAINHIKTTGGTLFVPEGIYMVEYNSIYLPSNTKLLGANRAKSIIKGIPRTFDDNDQYAIIHVDNVENVVVESLTIDGNKTNMTVTENSSGNNIECISFTNVVNCWVRQCNAINAVGDGLDWDDSLHSGFSECFFSDCGGNGNHFSLGTHYCIGSDSISVNCGHERSLPNGRNGFDVYSSASNCTYVNCIAKQSKRAGFNLRGDNNTVSACTVLEPSNNGVRIEGNRNTVSDVRIHNNNEFDGVKVSGENNKLNQISVANPDQNGFQIDSTAHNTIINGCSVDKPAGIGWGIRIQSDNSIVVNNIINHHKPQDSIKNDGSNNIVTNNIPAT